MTRTSHIARGSLTLRLAPAISRSQRWRATQEASSIESSIARSCCVVKLDR